MSDSKNNPLISVIVPVYNVEDLLERAVHSIQQQTYSRLEIILVDDGSTDRSGELCDTLAKQDSRIKVIHQSNQGLSCARNAGIKIAQGDFLTFVDSDDAVTDDLVETLYGLTAKYKTKMSICSFDEVWPNGKRRNFASCQEQKVFDTMTCLAEMLQERGFTLMACGKLYARELFNKVEFPAGKLYEDVGTTYKLVAKCPQIAVDFSAKYHYCQNPSSIIHQKFTTRNLDLITLTDQMCGDIERQFSDDLPRELSNALKLRRMHARFSILRMISRGHQATKREIITYLRDHRDDVLKNPAATQRDQLAMRSLLVGPWFFALAWRLYSMVR